MSARAASTKPAVSNSVRSETVPTLMPNFFCASGIGIAFSCKGVLNSARSAWITGSKLARSASCR